MGANRIDHVASLDGLRVFALVGVVVFHLFGISGMVTAGGDSPREWVLWTIFGNTLDVFFILSGFVLFLPVIRRGGKVGSKPVWYLKRFARIQPEYWACLVVLVLMIAYIPVDFQPAMPSLGNFLLHFFDLQTVNRMINPGVSIGFWIDGALWLVPVIAGLYLVFPWVAGFFYRHIWTGLLIAAVLTVAWKIAPTQLPALFQEISGNKVTNASLEIIVPDQTPAYFYSFALGMAAAWVFSAAVRNPESPWVRRGVIMAFAIGIPAYLLVSIPFTQEALQTTSGYDGSSRGRALPLNGLASTTVRGVLLLGIILGPLWLQKVFANRPVSWLAKQSYGIYLIHLPVAFYSLQLFSIPQTGTLRSLALWCAVVLPVATVYAWCSRMAVGEPSLRLVNRWIRRRDKPVRQL
ncbi:MAG: acyltransferase [Actinomycetota bacterium]|nr:acyltransferase [Actinomycetota bacterium]